MLDFSANDFLKKSLKRNDKMKLQLILMIHSRTADLQQLIGEKLYQLQKIKNLYRVFINSFIN